MSNTDDKDLNPVFANATNEELSVPHDIIVKKLAEMLTVQDVYKEHYPDHRKYSGLIADELRAFGGQTFVNVFRGGGPPYYEMVCDVARRIKAPFRKGQEIADVEASILATILEKAFEKMSEAEKLVVLQDLQKSNKSWIGGVSAMAFQKLFQAGGFRIVQADVDRHQWVGHAGVGSRSSICGQYGLDQGNGYRSGSDRVGPNSTADADPGRRAVVQGDHSQRRLCRDASGEAEDGVLRGMRCRAGPELCVLPGVRR